MKLVSVQILRATAALLVLFAHLWTPFTQFHAEDKFPNFAFGAAGVDLFFVISGFVMAYSSERFFGQPNGQMRFLLRRLARIVPLYWATTTFILLMLPVLGRTLASMDASRNVAALSYFFIPYSRPSGAMVPLHGVGWTLEFEMFFYALFALCVALPRRRAIFTAGGLLAGLMCLSWFFALPKGIAYLTQPYLLEFIFGLSIAYAYRSGWKIPRFSALCMIALGAFVYVWTCTQPINSEIPYYRFILWGGSAALILAGCVLSPFQWNPRWFAPFILIGEASYALYLTHTITLEAVWLSVAKRLPGTHPYLFAFLMAFFAIAVAIIVYKYFERPLTKALNARADALLSGYASSSTVIAEKSLP